MELKLTLLDQYNKFKKVKLKKSKCSHFYQRQFINNKAVTNWQRRTKKDFIFTLEAYGNSAAQSLTKNILTHKTKKNGKI